MTPEEFDDVCDRDFGFLRDEYAFIPGPTVVRYGGYFFSKRFEGRCLSITVRWDELDEMGEVTLHQNGLFVGDYGYNLVVFLIEKYRRPDRKMEDEDTYQWQARMLKENALDWLTEQRIV